MRDAGVEVVYRHGEVVEHRPVRPRDHTVIHAGVWEACLADDQVVDDRLGGIGHVQSHCPSLLLLAAEAAIGSVLCLERPDVISRGVRVVGVPAAQQLLEYLGVTRSALGLEDRALVPVQPEPAQCVEDLLDVLRGRSLAVGIFDP